jgi:redox-sensitive bicupin YhaK (pirin superfamily)
MNIIHFTRAAADPLDAVDAHFVPLSDGHGDTHVSCVHLDPGATINAPSLTHAAALLVVHGQITITSERGQPRSTDIHAGMGVVVGREEACSFKSDTGAILIIAEAEQLIAHKRGISTPERITGATWPTGAAG